METSSVSRPDGTTNHYSDLRESTEWTRFWFTTQSSSGIGFAGGRESGTPDIHQVSPLICKTTGMEPHSRIPAFETESHAACENLQNCPSISFRRASQENPRSTLTRIESCGKHYPREWRSLCPEQFPRQNIQCFQRLYSEQADVSAPRSTPSFGATSGDFQPLICRKAHRFIFLFPLRFVAV